MCLLLLLLFVGVQLSSVRAAGKNATDATQMKIVDITRIGGSIQVVYDLTLRRPQSDYQITTQAAIVGAKDTFMLEPIVLNGKNNIKKLHRDHVLNHKNEPEQEYYPQKLKVSVFRDTLVLPLAENRWLLSDTVHLCQLTEVKEGCCRVIENEGTCSEPYNMAQEAMETLTAITTTPVIKVVPRVVKPVTINTIRNNKVLVPIDHYTPYLRTEVLNEREDVLYVQYDVNKVETDYNYRRNSYKLDTIVKIVKAMQTDTMAQVRIIQIIGLASVEGNSEENEKLAYGRALSLKNYIQERTNLPDSLFEVTGGGEAWSEFGWMVSRGRFIGKDEMMKIIRNNNLLSTEKIKRMKALNGGKSYAWVKEHVFPMLRNAGYLRMFYEVKIDSAAVEINEGIKMIEERDFYGALEQLQKHKDDKRAWNALGVALYMTGEEKEAQRYWDMLAEEEKKTKP